MGFSEELPVKSDKFIQCSALSAQERWRENRGDGGIMGGLFNVSNIFALFFSHDPDTFYLRVRDGFSIFQKNCPNEAIKK